MKDPIVIVTFDDARDVRIPVLASQLTMVANALASAALKGFDSLRIAFPGCERELRVESRLHAVKLAADFIRAAVKADAQEQEARRQAGFSPASEHTRMEFDEHGEPVGARRTFRY